MVVVVGGVCLTFSGRREKNLFAFFVCSNHEFIVFEFSIFRNFELDNAERHRE